MRLMSIIFSIFALLSSGAHAALLNLSLETSPDIFSNFVFAEYDSSSNVFMAYGIADTLVDGSSASSINGGTFQIAAIVLNDGTLSNGTLVISGTVDVAGPHIVDWRLKRNRF